MELRTYTSLWQIERRLYRIDDVTLPGAPTYRQIGIFMVSAVAWVGLMILFRVPFSNPWPALWIMPPIAIAYFANRPIAENKTGIQLLTSNLKYVAQSPVYTGLRSGSRERLVHLHGLIWRKGAPEGN